MEHAGSFFSFHNSLNHCKGPHLAALPRQANALLTDVPVRAGPDGAGLGDAKPVEALLEAVAADAAGARVAQHVTVDIRVPSKKVPEIAVEKSLPVAAFLAERAVADGGLSFGIPRLDGLISA